jgi:hypothetical protein
MNADNAPGYRKASEHIVGGRDQALGIVTFPFVLEAALRVEFFTVLFRCRKIVLGAIEGEDRHPMPKKEWIARPKAVCQINGISENIAKDGPRHFAAGMGQRAAVDGSDIRPKTATPCRLEEFPDLMSTPWLFPLAARERIKAVSFEKGSFRLRVKSLSDCLAPGSMFWGIRLRKDATGLASWHGFLKQDLCHDDQLLTGFSLEWNVPTH